MGLDLWANPVQSRSPTSPTKCFTIPPAITVPPYPTLVQGYTYIMISITNAAKF